jgi:lysozyme family protein
MVDIAGLKIKNAERWAAARVTRNFVSVARALVEPSAKIRYLSVEVKTKVPWWVIAVIHEREASQNWRTQLAQGDPLNRVSVHVPGGRGPFATWEEGAFDALVNCSPHAARNDDWSIGGTLTTLEEYNGLGYAGMGRPSPYVWAGTNQYISGKYVRDGVFDPNVVDSQLGCAGLIKTMMTMDGSIRFGAPTMVQPAGTTTIPPKTTTVPVPPPVVPQPKISQGIWGNLISLVSSIFRRK